jgi:hypothetical protein
MWLPGYERHEYPGLAGKSFQFTHNPKGCMHTTEGGSIAGAMSAYAPYPPHLIYDWRNRRGVQHVRIDRAAYSATDGSDDDYMIQVELVGFAAETRDWPEQALRNVAADVVAPLEQHFGIPRRIIWHGFKDSRDGIYPYISSAESPIRINTGQLRDFSGWLGHQHLPAPDTHWDPGALPMARILGFLSEEDDMQLTDPITLFNHTTGKDGPFTIRDALYGMHRHAKDSDLRIARVEAKLDALAGALTDDEADLLAAIRAQPTGGQVDVGVLAPALAGALGPMLPDGIDQADVEAALANVLRRGVE